MLVSCWAKRVSHTCMRAMMHSGRMLFRICMASVSSCRTPLTMLVTQVASSLTRRWVLMRASSSDLFNGFLQGGGGGGARCSGQVCCVCKGAARCCKACSCSPQVHSMLQQPATGHRKAQQ